jgi:hypothetical protein
MALRSRRLPAAAAPAAILAATLAACGGLLEVSNEQDILDRNLDSPEAVAPLASGVAGDFAVAYASVIAFVGLFAQELIHTGSGPDWRTLERGIGTRPSYAGDQGYQLVSRAIWVADAAAVRIRKALPDAERRAELADVLVWGGFAHLLLADNYCQLTFHGGPAVTPRAGYERARGVFDDALRVATAAGDADARAAALGGRARVRLMLGDLTGARDDARQVSQGFRFHALYGTSPREHNIVVATTTTLIRREAGVHPRLYDDARFRTDPRTPFRDRGDTATGPDPTRRFVEQLKYQQRDTPIPVFTWQEARLIEAEAELRLGNPAGAVALIDQVRRAADLPACAGPMTRSAVLDQLVYERQAELWLQAQSLADWRRYELVYATQPRDRCFEIGQLEWDTNPNLRRP